MLQPSELARMIDHSIIDPNHTEADMIAGIELAVSRGCGRFTRPDNQDQVAHAIAIMRAALRPETIIKASGGVYDLDAVLAYYEAGARRFGASETAKILDDLAARNAAASEAAAQDATVQLAASV